MRPKYPLQRKRRLIAVMAVVFGGMTVFVALVAMAVFALFFFAKDADMSDGATTTRNASRVRRSEVVFFNPQSGPPSDPQGTTLSAAEYPEGALPPDRFFDALLLEKGKRRLTAFFKGKAVRVYQVALGEVPIGHKEYEGDKKTPEGKYTINDKNPKSAYYKNLGISYPSKSDRERAAALGKSPGGDIKIHGLAPQFAAIGAAHRLSDWTFGCIAVTNPEMEELFVRTPVGTPIEIKP